MQFSVYPRCCSLLFNINNTFPLTSLTVVTCNHVSIKIQMPKLPFIFMHSSQRLLSYNKSKLFYRILFNKCHENKLFNLYYLSYPLKLYLVYTGKKQRKNRYVPKCYLQAMAGQKAGLPVHSKSD